MNSIIIDAPATDEKRRELLYRGQLLVYSPTRSSLALVEFARKMAEEAFHPHDPETAQYHFPVERYAAILAEMKPKFIHAPESKKCIQGMLREIGADPEKTYFDVPRMRTSTSDDYLTSGIAYAFHPHRDTWYSAPMCQINWWMPIIRSLRKTPWLFTRAIGARRCETARSDTTTMNGIAPAVTTRRNS